MTAVEFNFTKPDGSPETGHVTFTPTRRNVHGEGVTLPEPFAVNLTNKGTFSADLKPTPPHWLWRINVVLHNGVNDVGYYYIPEQFFPLKYSELVPVDPSTVQTGLNPEPAWWAHIDSVKASAHSIRQAEHNAREAVEQLDGVVEQINDAAKEIRKQITIDIERAAAARRMSEEAATRASRHATTAYQHADTAHRREAAARNAATRAETAAATALDAATLESPNGTQWRITVDNEGTLSATPVEP